MHLMWNLIFPRTFRSDINRILSWSGRKFHKKKKNVRIIEWRKEGVWDRCMRFDYSPRGIISRRFAFKRRNESINLSDRVRMCSRNRSNRSNDELGVLGRCFWITQNSGLPSLSPSFRKSFEIHRAGRASKKKRSNFTFSPFNLSNSWYIPNCTLFIHVHPFKIRRKILRSVGSIK